MKKEKNNSPLDLTDLLQGYEDKFVVLTKDRKKILKSSDNVEDLKEYFTKGIVMLVPNTNITFSPLQITNSIYV